MVAVERGARRARLRARLRHRPDTDTGGSAVRTATDLAAEREVWRVEAARGLAAAGAGGRGVFDLVLDWTDGSWQLARCAD